LYIYRMRHSFSRPSYSFCCRYSDWKSWSTCAPCGIGNENGTYTRTRSCVFPDMFDYTTDYMGSEVCTTNQTVTTECSCGYIWSEWGSCDCSSEKQERNRWVLTKDADSCLIYSKGVRHIIQF